MTDPRDEIRRTIESVEADDDLGDVAAFAGEGEIIADSEADSEVVKACALLDPSDTDNALRFVKHFGDDAVVVATEASEGGDWCVWNGVYWSHADGAAAALLLAQKLGARIAMEAQYLTLSKREKEALKDAEAFAESDESESAKKARSAVGAVEKALAGRRGARWKFAVSSKNMSRIKNALTLAQPHLRRPARAFNFDPLVFACQSHTIRFFKAPDPENPDPDTVRMKWTHEAIAGHRRSDLITGVAPCEYDPDATCPKFRVFLDECQPDRDAQRTLQQYTAIGLLARLEQKIAYHYGNGANGKSVFLSVISAVIGDTQCVNLPKETIMGQGERGAGQASPDLIRLLWRRMLVVAELKDGEELREDVVKRLTGGDPMAVRGLYEGYIEFENVATPHMSGNGLPLIKGLDNGIWRRVFTIPWTVTIPEERRREFKGFVADLLGERSGILNWLIEGAVDYLQNGLFIAPACRHATSEYRAEMDPIGEFHRSALVPTPKGRMRAADLYAAYTCWAKANGRTEFGATKFGRVIKQRGVAMEESGGFRWYLGYALSPEMREKMDGREPSRDEGGER